MEQQILKIVACPQPYEIKKTLIQYCCKISLEPMDNEACYAVLKLAIQWILKESEALLVESGEMMLTSCAQHKTTALVSFFDEAWLLSLLQRDNVRPSGILDILKCVFPYLKSSSQIYPQLCKVFGHHITKLLKLNNTIEFCGRLADFLITYTDCLPSEKEHLLKINLQLIQSLGKTKTPNVPKDEMIEFFKKTKHVCELLHVIWQKDSSQSFVKLSVNECFEIVSNPEFPSTVALANLTNYVPDDVINPMISEVTMSSSIPDQQLAAGISKIVQWLVWPKETKVFQWILVFFKCLIQAGKIKVIENVVFAKILQVLCRVFMPVVRETNFIILVNMLLYSIESPVAFHMIIPFVPNLMDRLRSEKTEKALNYLNALGELIYTLMYKFPGFGDLYKALLITLKDIPKPSLEAMNKWLQFTNIAFVTEEDKTTSPLLSAPEMISSMKGTRKTGLVNLGNTCYMNSILQCLCMLDVFRNTLMSRRVSPTQHAITYSLQDVFTFLVMSKRDAVAPERFVRQSRPPWFPSRTQQDCCEFVQYMMDRLEEEDKELLQAEEQPSNLINIIQENFKGGLSVTYKCLKCGNESKHKEAFTDVLLAFPDKYPVYTSDNSSGISTDCRLPSTESRSENPKSLKGGDQIRKFKEPDTSSVFGEESIENPKESVPSVETAPNAQKNVPMSLKRHSERHTYTIHEMLDYFTKSEKLSGNNQYFCDECRENVDGERRVQIAELPKYLMLSLKRFSFDVKSQTKPKLLHIVHYPEELNFCSAGESIQLAHDDPEYMEDLTCKKSKLTEREACSNSLYSYNLCSVVVHSGHTCEAGHYYSYALDAQSKDHVGGASTSQWHCFNDEFTNETSYKEFIERENNLLTDTTYIVIYELQNVGTGQDDRSMDNEFVAPVEMIERVQRDNMKYFQEKRYLSTPQHKGNNRSNFDDDDDDKDGSSPPPGNCGSNGSNFSVPGNRFIF